MNTKAKIAQKVYWIMKHVRICCMFGVIVTASLLASLLIWSGELSRLKLEHPSTVRIKLQPCGEIKQQQLRASFNVGNNYSMHSTAALVDDDFVARQLKPMHSCVNISSNEFFSKFTKIIDNVMPLKRDGPCWIDRRLDPSVPRASSHSILCIPTFYVAGFPKCGTTSLYKMLIRHQQIVEPLQKEFHFGRKMLRANSTEMRSGILMQYLKKYVDPQHLTIRNKRLLTVDSSASTVLELPHSHDYKNQEYCLVPLLHKHFNPTSKFLLIMRNPVERAWSAYWYFCAHKHEPKEIQTKGPQIFHHVVTSAIHSFKECLARNESHFLCAMMWAKGHVFCLALTLGVNFYYFHIIKWFSVFPRQQFLFLRTEDLETSPLVVLNKMSTFLGIDSFPKTVLSESHSNVNTHVPRQDFKMMQETRKLLASFLAHIMRCLHIY